jgi:hypothetical protein
MLKSSSGTVHPGPSPSATPSSPFKERSAGVTDPTTFKCLENSSGSAHPGPSPFCNAFQPLQGAQHRDRDPLSAGASRPSRQIFYHLEVLIRPYMYIDWTHHSCN